MVNRCENGMLTRRSEVTDELISIDSQFHHYLLCLGACLASFNSVLNVKAQENALVGAFSVIVKTDGSFAALKMC